MYMGKVCLSMCMWVEGGCVIGGGRGGRVSHRRKRREGV